MGLYHVQFTSLKGVNHMAGTNRPNGSQGQIDVKRGVSQYIKAPNTAAKQIKPQVVRGGDLRARGSSRGK